MRSPAGTEGHWCQKMENEYTLRENNSDEEQL